ncbi:MAG: penicillin-binding protein 2 [Verrucomicrobia bacterium]|nr:penicillin-binding protein 2 [Verrucomicrobiota bacterium]
MKIRRTDRSSSLRIYVVLSLMGVAFLVLAGALWRLQVARVSQFENRQQIQSLRRVRLPGIRGKIYDRNGLCMADNRPVYSIALFPEDVRRPGPWSRTIDRAMDVMAAVSKVTDLEPVIDRDKIWAHLRRRLPLPLVLWSDVTPKTMALFAEQGGEIRGVDLYTQATRAYPYGPYTSHLLGYVGRADPDLAAEDRYNYYLPEMGGRAGLEKTFDEFLRGEGGGAIVQIDVTGYNYGEIARREPKRGGDLRLTLDMEVQLLAHQALSTNRGAVVVLDPNNGDVLAMLSAPGFDANLFVPYIRSEDWKKLSEDPGKPMLNRAVAGVYSPGSTFKPLVALAASTVNPQAVHAVYESPGTFVIGRRVVHTHGFGEVDMRQALELSANVYFFKIALENGWEPIVEQALAIGLGKKTGVEVDYEASGVVPDADWLRSSGKGGWTDGDTCNLAIGQGYLGTTPLQMAMLTATIANGGTLYRPRLLQAYREPNAEVYTPTPSRRVGKMNWPTEALDVVRGGMLDVVMSRKGTGRIAAVNGFEFAAKTGTAEYGIKSEGKKHTWMIAFAPFDDPQYAVAFLIEDGVSGGSTVGPRLKLLMEGLFTKMQREGTIQRNGGAS